MNSDFPAPDDDSSGDHHDRPSKSQVKRDMHALLDLGKELTELSPERLRQLPLAEKLHDAVREAQRITSREGRRRQIHYVGKLMRDAPADLIRAQLDEWRNGSRALTAHMHQLEALRDALIADDEPLTALLGQHPQADIQRLRALIRAARKEALHNRNPAPGQDPQRKHYRALFQELKALHDTDTSIP